MWEPGGQKSGGMLLLLGLRCYGFAITLASGIPLTYGASSRDLDATQELTTWCNEEWDHTVLLVTKVCRGENFLRTFLRKEFSLLF